MNRLMQFSTVLTLSLASTISAAADDEKKFDGFYVGAESGLDYSTFGRTRERDTSFYYGGIIGIRKQLESGLTFGLEATFGDSGFSSTNVSPPVIAGAPIATFEQSVEYEWSIGATIGTVFGAENNNLLYGKIAHVVTRGRTRIVEFQDNGFSENIPGIRIGAGFEHAFSDAISLRIEVDYTNSNSDIDGWAVKPGLLFKF
ncbi:MAG: porin family protein [Kordiimonadaceae bacterium]|nr:porin family protein [Kordiimonadaceae bacterium]